MSLQDDTPATAEELDAVEALSLIESVQPEVCLASFVQWHSALAGM